MRRGGRVQYQAAGVADIGEVRKQPHALDELYTGFVTALHTEGEDRARTFRKIFSRERIEWAGLQPGIRDPGDARMAGKELRDLLGIGDVPLHAHVQALNAG